MNIIISIIANPTWFELDTTARIIIPNNIYLNTLWRYMLTHFEIVKRTVTTLAYNVNIIRDRLNS